MSVTAVGSNLTALRPNIVNGWKEAAPKPADFVAPKKKTTKERLKSEAPALSSIVLKKNKYMLDQELKHFNIDASSIV